MTMYLQEAVTDAKDNPLIRWKTNQACFPLMAKLVRKYFCICTTSCPSERVFSAAHDIVTPVRSLLKPEKVKVSISGQKP